MRYNNTNRLCVAFDLSLNELFPLLFPVSLVVKSDLLRPTDTRMPARCSTFLPKLIIGQSRDINMHTWPPLGLPRGSRLNKALLLIYFWPQMRVRTAYHVFVTDSNVKTILSATKWEREFSPGYHFSSLNRLCLFYNPYGFFRVLQVIKVNSKVKNTKWMQGKA